MNIVAMGINAPIPRKTDVSAWETIASSTIWPITARVTTIIINTGMPTPKICT
jgi:hypothetical protein